MVLNVPGVRAADVYEASASKAGAVYRVQLDARVDAPEPRVRRLLTDYAHLGRINPDIKRSEILFSRRPGAYRVRTLTEVCVLFYCKRLRQVQDVIESPDGSVTATVLPGQSDFRYGVVHLSLRQEPGGTRVLMRGELEPDFWIPPVIGPWLVRRKLISEALTTVANLERVAPLEGLPHNNAISN